MKRRESPLEKDPDWEALAASIAGGIGHELNGRITSLLGIAHVARTSRTLEGDLLDDLESEIQRLKRAAILLRRLPFFASTEPRLDEFADVVRDATLLYAHAGGRSLPFVREDPTDDAGPVWLDAASLAKGLILLIAASDAAQPDADIEVRMLAPTDGARSVAIEATGGAALQPIASARALAEGRTVIETLGGRVVVEESSAASGRHRITITLPAATPPFLT